MEDRKNEYLYCHLSELPGTCYRIPTCLEIALLSYLGIPNQSVSFLWPSSEEIMRGDARNYQVLSNPATTVTLSDQC